MSFALYNKMKHIHTFATSTTSQDSYSSQRRLVRLQQIESMENAAMGLTTRTSLQNEIGTIAAGSTAPEEEEEEVRASNTPHHKSQQEKAILDASLRMLWRERVEQIKRGRGGKSSQREILHTPKFSSSRAA